MFGPSLGHVWVRFMLGKHLCCSSYLFTVHFCRSKIASHTARAFSRSRSRSYSVMRTFDEKRGVWRMRKPRDLLARYETVVVHRTSLVESIILVNIVGFVRLR